MPDTFVVCDGFKDALAKAVCGGSFSVILKLRLFTNAHTPVEGDVAADYTEATEMGYMPITLNFVDWTFTTTLHVVYADHAQVEFDPTAAGTWYGCYITDDGLGLVGAAKFAAPMTFGGAGGAIKVTPQLQIGLCGGSI